jgi:2-keto-3-deoxy-6-phosphogluconate aldolase
MKRFSRAAAVRARAGRALIPLASLVIALTALADTLTPVQLTMQIDHLGAAAVARRLVANGQFDQVLRHIEAGSDAWLALAPRLAEGTDAAASEDLGIALATALPKNALGVLSVIDPHDGPVIGVTRVCGVPFVEGTAANLDAYVRHAVAAVGTIDVAGQPALARMQRACLAALRQ